MKFIFEEDDDSEEVELSFVEALKKWLKGEVDDNQLEDIDKHVIIPARKNSIKAQTVFTFEFNNDDDFLHIIDLNDDDINFLTGINSHYRFEFMDGYSVEEDFKEGYGPLGAFNKKNEEKWEKICFYVTGKKYDWSNPDQAFLKNMLTLFDRQTNWIIDDYHMRKEEEMAQSAIKETDKELKEYLNSIGFKLKRDWDMITTTPANLIMYCHRYKIKEGSFEDLFKIIVEKNPSNLGGWWDNMYEFGDSSLFDIDAFNNVVERYLDEILEQLESEPEKVEFYTKLSELTDKFKIGSWYQFPSNPKYNFLISKIDSDNKIYVRIYKSSKKWERGPEKNIKVGIDTLNKILYQPTLFGLEQIFEQKKSQIVSEGFDPIYFIKNFFKEKQKVFDRGDSWEMKDEMQKYVDVLYKLVEKQKPSKTIKGLEVVKVSKRSFIRKFDINLEQEINVVVKAILPSWENPDNHKLVDEFDFYKQIFNKILKATGLDYDSATGTQFRFNLYLK